MKFSEYKTGMILKENNDYYLVLGIFDYVIEQAKLEISMYDLSVIEKDINSVLYSKSISLLELDDAKVDFTKEINSSLVFPVHLGYFKKVEIVKTVKIPESWVLTNKMLNPSLRGLMTVEEGVNELKKALNQNKYKKAVETIKKKSTFQKITRVKSNQIVAAKLLNRYRIFLVEDTRVIEFYFSYSTYKITNLGNIDLSKMQRIEMQRIEIQLVDAKEYYLLAEVR